ncbi:hypothetical protein [Tahibacter amnicola]|uniref:Thioredoxin n=1 Tax=Tahibacter amnicola TaxID=2976241 RepID=A0ABY6BFB1_9GAMM|nr:hypothetical protein [Tahibacter amnicola]UXI68721.1 hypothetical protein N4264_03450 [Tahibacter amnicola]
MNDSAVPDFFTRFPMRAVTSSALDETLAAAAEAVCVLFLWGRDCPNCDLAKRAILATPGAFTWPQVQWLHCNVYDDDAMAPRFGLHGIPAFFLFHRSRRLGRITAWPGREAFVAAVEEQIARCAAHGGDR